MLDTLSYLPELERNGGEMLNFHSHNECFH
jgi:hypothetical protein